MKGNGYEKAEKNPELYHGVKPFDISCGIKNDNQINFSSVFGNEMKQQTGCRIFSAAPRSLHPYKTESAFFVLVSFDQSFRAPIRAPPGGGKTYHY